jgi:diguanylate cyclase (GGDEF)-like protein
MQAGGDQVQLHLERAHLGAGVAAVMALVLALAALLELFDGQVAAEGCIALAVLIGVFYALLRSGRTLRYADPSLAAWQIGALYVLLAYLTYRTADTAAALSVLYMVVTLYGLLRLEAHVLIVLSAIALVLHGVAIFMLVDSGARMDLAAAWTQFGALVLGMLWSSWAAVTVTRLRTSVAEANGKLHTLAETSREKTSRDELTGAYNRRQLMEALEREASRASRTGNLLCIARIDLDRMRSINESFGNAVGDDVLRHFAELSHRVARDVDTFGRWGGKSFLMIMPDTGYSKAIIGAERLRAAVEREEFPEFRVEWAVSCTVGLAQYRKGEDLALVLERAEAALNYAKAAGRNRVVAFDEDGKPYVMK